MLLLSDLPVDVWHVILSICSTTSLNALILTSSQCKDLATAHFLRSVRLNRNPAQVIAFLNYILSNAQFYDDGNSVDRKRPIGAGTHVRTLEILPQAFKTEQLVPIDPATSDWELETVEPHPISTWAPILARALVLMPNLRAIAVKLNVDEIVHSSPEFPFTLMDMPQLHTLDLGGLTSQTSAQFGEAMTLMRLRHGGISLRRVVLDSIESLVLCADKGMGSILFSSRESLVEIELLYCDLTCGLLCGVQTGTRDNAHRAPVVFPSVTNISLTCCVVSSGPLSHSFPNVHTLTIAHNAPWGDSTCSACCPTSPRKLFPNLSTLAGSYADLLVFLEMHGPFDNLRRLVIQNIWDNELFFLLGVPHLRSFHFSLWNAGSFSWWTELANSLPSLTFLSFNGHIQTELDVELFCVELPQLLASLSLEYIALTLSFIPFRWWEPPNEYIPHVSNTDETIALAYAQNIPTLKYFEILRGTRTWWRVVHEKPGTAGENDVNESFEVRKIDDEEGENIRDFFDWNWRS